MNIPIPLSACTSKYSTVVPTQPIPVRQLGPKLKLSQGRRRIIVNHEGSAWLSCGGTVVSSCIQSNPIQSNPDIILDDLLRATTKLGCSTQRNYARQSVGLACFQGKARRNRSWKKTESRPTRESLHAGRGGACAGWAQATLERAPRRISGKGGPTGDGGGAPCVGHRTAAMECTSRPRADRFGPVGAVVLRLCRGSFGIPGGSSRRTALLLPVQRSQLAGGAGERFFPASCHSYHRFYSMTVFSFGCVYLCLS
jgi:hypothetical protein